MGTIYQETEKYYGIGTFSKVTGIPITTLRYYDEKGILVPRKRNESSNYRYYSALQIHDAMCIQQLKHLGIPLPDIQEELASRQVNGLKMSLEDRMQQCQAELQKVHAQYTAAAKIYEFLTISLSLLQQRDLDENATNKVEVRYLPQTFILGKYSATSNFVTDNFVKNVAEMYQVLEDENLELDGSIHLRFVNHTPERFQSGDCTTHQFFPIKPTESQHPDIGTYGGFWCASIVYIGLFNQISTAYGKLEEYLKDNNLYVNGDPFEEYPLNHLYLKDPNSYITRISFPIKDPC